MAETPEYQIPYPEGGDEPDVVTDMKNLAERVEELGKNEFQNVTPAEFISTDPDNAIATGSDDLLFAEDNPTPAEFISTDPDNYLEIGSDDKLHVAAVRLKPTITNLQGVGSGRTVALTWDVEEL